MIAHFGNTLCVVSVFFDGSRALDFSKGPKAIHKRKNKRQDVKVQVRCLGFLVLKEVMLFHLMAHSQKKSGQNNYKESIIADLDVEDYLHIIVILKPTKNCKPNQKQNPHHSKNEDHFSEESLLLFETELAHIFPINSLVITLSIVLIQNFTDVFAFLMINQSKHRVPFCKLEEVNRFCNNETDVIDERTNKAVFGFSIFLLGAV